MAWIIVKYKRRRCGMLEVMQSQATLGSITKSTSTRCHKIDLQSIAGRILPGERVAWCGKRATGRIEIRKGEAGNFYHGLARCGSVWTCPVCASKISEARRAELVKAAQAGYSMLLVSVTLQHSRGDELKVLLSALSEALSQTRSGRAWQSIEARYQIVASVSALEFTYSLKGGYHPHKHLLLYSTLPEAELDAEAFKAELNTRWLKALAKVGRYGSEYYAINVTKGKRPVGAYLSKWGVIEEVTKNSSKEASGDHFTMWQVLERAGEGEAWPVMVFKEYAEAVKGKRWLVWSKGARRLFSLDEVSDQELAKAEPEAELVAVISRQQWHLVLKYELRSMLLSVSEREGGAGVYRFLDELERKFINTV